MKDLEFYLVCNCENGHAYLVNASNYQDAISIVAEERGYETDVLNCTDVCIPEGTSTDLENLLM